MSEKNLITLDGHNKIQEKLKNLGAEMEETVKVISSAAAHGDLRENGEYQTAVDHKKILSKRIQDLKDILNNSQIIDINKAKIKSGGKVVFGSVVVIKNLDNNKEFSYQIVGINESNLEESTISINSPLAKALIGKKKSENIMVATPRGEIKYKIISVS